MSDTINDIGKRIVETTGSNSGMFLMFTFVFVISIYVAYQLYNIVVKTDLQTKILVKDVVNIASNSTSSAGMFQLNKTSDDEVIELPVLNNGNEYSFSYWLYLDDFKTSVNPKLIMSLGTGSRLSSSDIIMYMDPGYTKMHVLLRTNNSGETAESNLKTIHENSSNCEFYRIEVPYVPINRWINFTLVVDDNYIQLFMDG